MRTPDAQTIASMIDHTILKADATREQVIEYCRQARKYGFASVCVNPCHVALVKKELQGSGVRGTVIGFSGCRYRKPRHSLPRPRKGRRR